MIGYVLIEGADYEGHWPNEDEPMDVYLDKSFAESLAVEKSKQSTYSYWSVFPVRLPA